MSPSTHRDVGVLDFLNEFPPRGKANLVVLACVQTPNVSFAQHLAQRRYLFKWSMGMSMSMSRRSTSMRSRSIGVSMNSTSMAMRTSSMSMGMGMGMGNEHVCTTMYESFSLKSAISEDDTHI